MEYKIISTRSDNDLSGKVNILAEEGWKFASISATAVPPHGAVMKVVVMERDELEKAMAEDIARIDKEAMNAALDAEYYEIYMDEFFDEQVRKDHLDYVENNIAEED